jgi:hypothetical protein
MGFGIKKETVHFLQFTGGGAQVTASTTAYAPINGTTNFNATENNRQALIARPCKVSELVIQTTVSQPASGNIIFTVRKNGVDTALTITIAANGAGGVYTDSTNVVSFAKNELISLKAVNNATSSSTALISWYIKTI